MSPQLLHYKYQAGKDELTTLNSNFGSPFTPRYSQEQTRGYGIQNVNGRSQATAVMARGTLELKPIKSYYCVSVKITASADQ